MKQHKLLAGSTVSECDCATATLHSHPKLRTDPASKQPSSASVQAIANTLPTLSINMIWACPVMQPLCDACSHTCLQAECCANATQYDDSFLHQQTRNVLQISLLAVLAAMAAVERTLTPCITRQLLATCSQVSYPAMALAQQ